MEDTKYRGVTDSGLVNNDINPKTSRGSSVSYGGHRMCSQRLCLILFTLFIAFGAMGFFVFTVAFRSSDNEMELYKRALHYITGDRFARSEDGGSDFPHKDILLPKDILPTRYQVYLHPNLTTFDFEGGVKIDLLCKNPTKNVILHMRDLKILEYKVREDKTDGKLLEIKRTAENKKHDQYLVELVDDLKAGQKYILRLSFSGKLSDKMAGFYKSSYKTKTGKTRYLATTQFESTDARAAFPCFDEPEFKANFIITMVHEKEYKAISNMPVELVKHRDDGLVQSHFKATVKMSTYLVAFIVCDFGYKEATISNRIKVRVWARKDVLDSTDLALKVATNVLSYYEKFFNIKYPLPKADLIAVPDFASGAMENWGLLTFRETYLLNNPATSSAADQQDVAIVVAHELAHQWFGNLVTMKWWNDLWLNEGFANYVEYIGTDQYAKDWKVLDQFVAHTLQSALASDSMTNTHAIRVPVQNPSQITEIFDAISYEKGSSVIRMLRSFIGDQTFQKGLELYLNKHAYKNAEADDLWSALSEVSNNLDVKAVMDTWISQKGYPVITIKSDRSKRSSDSVSSLVAQQHRFLRDIGPDSDKYQDETEGYSWYVPLTYVTSDSPKKPITVWLNKTYAHLNIKKRSSWFKANIQQTGFYRVNYEEANWLQLINQLNNNHKVFSPVDRCGLIDDAFSLSRAGLVRLTTALGLTSYLDKEREYVPWSSALSSLAFIGSQLSLKPSYGLYSKYIVNKVKPLEKYVGWVDKGNILKKYLRSNVLSTLASHGDYNAVRFCLEGFRAWMTNDSIEISPHLREIVYHTAIKFGSVHEWEFLWRKYEQSIDPTEKGKLLHGLSGSRDTWLLQRLLEYSIDESKIRTQDMTSAISGVSGHTAGRLLAWDFFRVNFDKIIKKIGRDAIEIGYLIIGTTHSFNTDFHLKQVEAFVEQHKDVLGPLRATKKALEIIQGNILWMKRHEDEAETWLRKQVKNL